jgi:hypothetical protein
LENIWEAKGNINGRTDIGEKLAFSEKVWRIEEEIGSIAYSRINVPSKEGRIIKR